MAMLITAAILAIFVYGMIAAMLGTILPDLSVRFQLTPKQNGTIAFCQALGLIIAGAKLFVLGVEQVAALTGLSALVLSLIVIPVATEMPEKFNSILWVRRDKDTLAFGNLTGAMVFQGTLLPAFGLQLSAWTPGYQVLWAMGLSFAAALWTLFLALRRKLTPLALMVNGSLYVLFFLVIIRS